MSAPDHLNIDQIGPLFHGSSSPLSDRARKVRAFRQESGFDTSYEGRNLAFATTNYDLAKQHGVHVYQVMPDQHTRRGVGKDVYISEKGFDIVRKLPDEELTQRNLVESVKYLQWKQRQDQERGRDWEPHTESTDIRDLSFKILGPTRSPHGSLNMHLFKDPDHGT